MTTIPPTPHFAAGLGPMYGEVQRRTAPYGIAPS